jgi:hypothetical protein
MSKAVVGIRFADEEDPTQMVEVTGSTKEVTGGHSNEPMTPNQIVEALLQMDPDDLEDLQNKLYEALWSENGLLNRDEGTT